MDVSVLAVDGAFDSGLASVLDVIRTANELRGELAERPARWRVRCVTARQDQVRTAAGHLVDAVPAHRAGTPDLLVIAGAWLRPEGLAPWLESPEQEAVYQVIQDAYQAGAAVAAACSATFLVAEAGLLDGRPATTTWWLAPQFRQRYPRVLLDETLTISRTPRITTAGAAMAHLDLALSLVRDTSPSLADLTARYLLLDSRPSQAVYAIPEHLARADPTVSAYERWIREHLDQPLRVAEAARALGVSERTLQRSLERVTGVSPLRFAQRIRLEQAVHLLKTTDLPTDAVARRVGYENGTTLITLVRKQLGTTPGRIRARTGVGTPATGR